MEVAALSSLMNIVLIDTRHHRTLAMPYMTPTVLQPVIVSAGRILDAVFTFQGDFLRGDPIYLQTGGPWLSERWWHQ